MCKPIEKLNLRPYDVVNNPEGYLSYEDIPAIDGYLVTLLLHPTSDVPHMSVWTTRVRQCRHKGWTLNGVERIEVKGWWPAETAKGDEVVSVKKKDVMETSVINQILREKRNEVKMTKRTRTINRQMAGAGI